MSEIEITHQIREAHFIFSRIIEQETYIAMISNGSLPEERKREIIESAVGVKKRLVCLLIEIIIMNSSIIMDILLVEARVHENKKKQ